MVMRINEYQKEILKELALENYINELILHCDQNFPYLKRTMDEEKLRQTLKVGVQKANEIGFTQRGSVRFYIELLIIFGFEFETDLQYTWLIQSLTNSEYKTQLEKASKTYDAVTNYQEKILGTNNQYFLDMAQKLEKLSINTIEIYKTNFERQILDVLQDLYPQKFNLNSRDNMWKFVQIGMEKAEKSYGFESLNHVALIIVLMFLLGHEFDHDPFYEWASVEKTNSLNEFSTVKAGKLEKRAKIWLDNTLSHNGE